MKPIKKVAVLHSLCSVGKASLTNMIPILSAMGMEVCPIPTVLLSTHTGYPQPAKQTIEPAYIRILTDHYKENDISFDLIFVGYLGSVEMVDAVKYFLNAFPNVPIVLDPVMGDHGKYYNNINEAYVSAFRSLIPYAKVILPNLTEAALLSDLDYVACPKIERLTQIAEKLHALGAYDVIITSASEESDTKQVFFSNSKNEKIVKFLKEATDFHGTGDVFDAVFIGTFLKGKTISECIEEAHRIVALCIQKSVEIPYSKKEGLCIEVALSELF